MTHFLSQQAHRNKQKTHKTIKKRNICLRFCLFSCQIHDARDMNRFDMMMVMQFQTAKGTG